MIQSRAICMTSDNVATTEIKQFINPSSLSVSWLEAQFFTSRLRRKRVSLSLRTSGISVRFIISLKVANGIFNSVRIRSLSPLNSTWVEFEKLRVQ